MLTLWLCQKILCFFGLRNVSSIMSLITAFLFFFMDLFQEQDLFHLLSPTSHLFFLITILVLALSSPLWSKSEVKVKVAQSGLTLYDPMDLYSPWNSPGQNRGVGSLSLLKRSFLTQELNWGPHSNNFVFQIYFCLFFFGCTMQHERS